MSARILVQHLHERRAGLGRTTDLPETTSFLSPTAPQYGRYTKDGVWVPPSASIASRKPPARSRAHCRGFVVDQAANRALVFESGLERDFAAMLMADRRVAHIHDQPPAVIYKTPDGRAHRHTFDFLVTTVDGRRIAFAVKPEAKVERSGIKTVLELISQQAPHGFADTVKLRTERHITKVRAFNARCILRARLARNEEDIAALREVLLSVNGAIRMVHLMALSKLGARAWAAIVCLIDEGELELTEQDSIGDLAWVRRCAPVSR